LGLRQFSRIDCQDSGDTNGGDFVETPMMPRACPVETHNSGDNQ